MRRLQSLRRMGSFNSSDTTFAFTRGPLNGSHDVRASRHRQLPRLGPPHHEAQDDPGHETVRDRAISQLSQVSRSEVADGRRQIQIYILKT